MVLLSGIIGTVASVWLYYNFCGWLNILNCTLPPVGMILVLAYFMNKEDFEADQPKLKTVDWFAVAGVILGAIVANLLHWGIASINGMVVAAVCYCVGQVRKQKKISKIVLNMFLYLISGTCSGLLFFRIRVIIYA